MELCHPATLQDWIQNRNRHIPESDHSKRIGDALDVFEQIMKGLAHIHSKGIIHRDLKPSNIFASDDGKVVKIGDFGLSKKMQGLSPNICNTSNNENGKKSPIKTTMKTTSPSSPRTTDNTTYNNYWQKEEFQGALMLPQLNNGLAPQGLHKFHGAGPLTAGVGTASYASPEQVKSRSYGTPADIFSVGLIFLELVSCFETEHERLHNFQQCRYQKVPNWLEEQYPHLAQIILACTKPAAKERPTAAELLVLSKKPTSPKASVEVQVLKGQLLEKDKQLAEKDKLIEDMRLEMERMKASLSSTTEPTQSHRVVVESVAASDDDEQEDN